MNNTNIKIYTIGFTETTAENFFARLSHAGVRKVIDIRLWADTQLSGFARKKDLGFFLKSLIGVDYEHRINLAPAEEILKDFKNGKIDWKEYGARYITLLANRKIIEKLKPEDVADSCFLCAEKTPHFCHRRLLAEYLKNEWNSDAEIIHL